MKRTFISIKGMHCRSCEIRVEDELLKVPGVKKADVNHKTGIAYIHHSNASLSTEEISNAVSGAGYKLGVNKKSTDFFSSNKQDYIDVVLAVFIVGLIFIIIKELGLIDISVAVTPGYGNLGIAFLVGVTAGLSTCMTLVGGLVLGISSRFNQTHAQASSKVKFIPHLFFNAGRVGGFFLLGGLIGMIGSLIQLSTGFIGLLTVIVGTVMIVLGLQLIGIFPGLSTISLTLPKVVSRIFGITEKAQNEYSHTRSFILGVLTFFLPCGFTQAIQLYAVSTGSFLKGALVMAVFAAGTMPGLLSVGGITSIVKGSSQKLFFRYAGVVIIGLALFNIFNGINLFHVATGVFSSQTDTRLDDPNVLEENGIQTVRMIQDNHGYNPNTFTIKKGIPVRWIVRSTDPYSCASSLIMPAFNIRTNLTEEEKILEFTPSKSGQIPFSCSMGMYTGKFNVIED